jgi:predicted dithiol-disulfide oxidoreductase (DUF899 family)
MSRTIALLVKEKEATRLRDKVNSERLALLWVEAEKELRYRHAQGKEGALAEL